MWARYRLGRRVDIWYHPEYAPAALAETARGSSIEVHRGRRILDSLRRDGLVPRWRVRRPRPASVAELLRFHTLAYLESTNEPENVARVFGFEPSDVDAEAVVRASLRTTGGTIAAARDVVSRPGKVAFNLGGGYHHAQSDLGAGFCVHNDVAVAIANLRNDGFGGRVLIIDLDYHQGDGFIDSFDQDPTVLVYSIHGSVWSHTESHHQQYHLEGRVGDRRYMTALRQTLPAAFAHRPELVFYLAGNDVMAGDALGTFGLTLQGVLDRDRYVLDWLRQHNVPAVVMLAGGYSRDAWRASYAMIRYALTDDPRVPHAESPNLRERFTEIAAQLDPVELQQEGGDDPFRITEADLMGSLFGPSRSDRLLDFYSAHGVELALERYGLIDALRARGFASPRLTIDTADRSHQVIRVYGARRGSAEVLLIELVMRRWWMPDPTASNRQIEVLSLEWLLMQDPTRSFSLARMPLPGQAHPGLGVAFQMQEVLIQASRRLGLHGWVNQPAYFHTAAGIAEALFVNPKKEGVFRALKRDIAASPDDVSRAIDEGRVRWGDGETFEWKPGLRMLPVSEKMIAWFSGETYADEVQAAEDAARGRGLHLEPAPSPAVAS